jgi:hypothetical protein
MMAAVFGAFWGAGLNEASAKTLDIKVYNNTDQVLYLWVDNYSRRSSKQTHREGKKYNSQPKTDTLIKLKWDDVAIEGADYRYMLVFRDENDRSKWDALVTSQQFIKILREGIHPEGHEIAEAIRSYGTQTSKVNIDGLVEHGIQGVFEYYPSGSPKIGNEIYVLINEPDVYFGTDYVPLDVIDGYKAARHMLKSYADHTQLTGQYSLSFEVIPDREFDRNVMGSFQKNSDPYLVTDNTPDTCKFRCARQFEVGARDNEKCVAFLYEISSRTCKFLSQAVLGELDAGKESPGIDLWMRTDLKNAKWANDCSSYPEDQQKSCFQRLDQATSYKAYGPIDWLPSGSELREDHAFLETFEYLTYFFEVRPDTSALNLTQKERKRNVTLSECALASRRDSTVSPIFDYEVPATPVDQSVCTIYEYDDVPEWREHKGYSTGKLSFRRFVLPNLSAWGDSWEKYFAPPFGWPFGPYLGLQPGPGVSWEKLKTQLSEDEQNRREVYEKIAEYSGGDIVDPVACARQLSDHDISSEFGLPPMSWDQASAWCEKESFKYSPFGRGYAFCTQMVRSGKVPSHITRQGRANGASVYEIQREWQPEDVRSFCGNQSFLELEYNPVADGLVKCRTRVAEDWIKGGWERAYANTALESAHQINPGANPASNFEWGGKYAPSDNRKLTNICETIVYDR